MTCKAHNYTAPYKGHNWPQCEAILFGAPCKATKGLRETSCLRETLDSDLVARAHANEALAAAATGQSCASAACLAPHSGTSAITRIWHMVLSCSV